MSESHQIFSSDKRYGVELLHPALNPDDRKWVPMLKGRSTRYRFHTEEEARQFVVHLLSITPQLEFRVVTFD